MSKRVSTQRRPVVQAPPSIPFWERRGTLLLAAALVFAVVFFAYAGPAWAAAAYRLLTDGPLLLLWLAAMLGAGGWIARLLGFREREPGPGLATIAALGIGGFSLLILALGWAGLLHRGVAWALIAAAIAAGIVDRRRDPRFTLPALSSKLRERVEWTAWLGLIAAPFLAIAVLAAFMPPGLLWGDEPNGYDVLEYHLQIPREWFQAARILPLHHNVFSYFPFNVEMHYLLAMHLRGGPWAGMYLAQLMHVAMVVLAVVAIAGFVGRPGIKAWLLAATTPWLTLLAPVAYNEGGLLLFGSLAIGWTWRSIQQPERRVRRMALAGTMAGLACGVKLTAAPMLLAAVPLAAGAVAIFAKQKAWLRPLGAFVLCGLLAFSPWLLRNVIWARNPVFPEAMPLLGHAHFTPEQVERWRLAYVPPPAQRPWEARLKASWDQIFADWRFGFVLIPAGLFALLRGRRDPASIFLLLLVVMWLVFWLFFTHLQSRFFVLAIPVMALLAAQIRTPIGNLLLLCAVVLQAGFGLLHLDNKVVQRVQPALMYLGIDRYDAYDRFPITDERLEPFIKGTHRICLVGDANPFIYEVPMSRLQYRTLFDLDVRGRGVVQAWQDGYIEEPGDVRYVDDEELRRMAWKDRTGTGYWALPAPPPGAQGRQVIPVGK
jgi:hypothetical protein